ncbi:LamG domain-containing protein [Marinobacter sp. CA1]|uniref:LamG domain-containing protein n=1 Tax=Marinobacter sp. CA1 TaxID=2817656 RepID=UPI001D064102|nr:LamG domain-containing protein [Marinobacter sp. CA1]UDL03968.1 hypothetical protein J2887_14765 [Marinobacter sp. CA1]
MPLAGNVTTVAGITADYVRIFLWPDQFAVGAVRPAVNGDWSFEVPIAGDYGVTYIAAGCRPMTEGPYNVPAGAVDGLVLLYTMDSIDGGVVVDQVGNFQGAIDGDPQIVGGPVGTSLRLDGAGDRVVVGDVGITDAVTLSAKVSINTLPSNDRVVLFGLQDEVGSRYNLTVSLETDGSLRLWCTESDGNQSTFNIGEAFQQGDYFTLIIDHQNGRFRMFIDDITVVDHAGPPGGIGGEALDLVIGADITAIRYASMDICQFRVFSRVLADIERQWLKLEGEG